MPDGAERGAPPRRWVAPPGWPEPPAGWSPPSGWQPDPSWPAPPPGWLWWQPGPERGFPWGRVMLFSACIGGLYTGLLGVVSTVANAALLSSAAFTDPSGGHV